MSRNAAHLQTPIDDMRKVGPSWARLVRYALALLPLQVIVRAGEAVMPLLAATWFGHSEATDVFYAELAIFQLAGSLIFSAYQDSALIPIVTKLRVRDAHGPARIFGILLGYTLLGGTLLASCTAVIACFAAAMASGPGSSTMALAIALPLTLYLPALSVRMLLAAFLNAEGRYAAPTWGSLVGTMVLFAWLLATQRQLGIRALPWGMLVYELAASVTLWATSAARFLAQTRISLAREEAVIHFARLAGAEVVGGALTRVNPVIDQLMATALGVAGGGTLLRYSLDVALTPTSVLQGILFPMLLSRFAGELARHDWASFRRSLRESVAVVVALLAAFSLVLYAVRQPLLEGVFLHGRMDREGVRQMVEVLPWHLVGLAPFGALLVLSRAHIALMNSRIMVGMGALNAVLNALMNVLLAPRLGLCGIALSTSLVHALIALVFYLRAGPAIRRAAAAASRT